MHDAMNTYPYHLVNVVIPVSSFFSCYRVYVTHLVLYNLMIQEGGRHGFFRWNEDICGFIQANWMRLMPHRKRTQSWHSTVAGTLSVHCPAIFKSGIM